MTTTTAMPGAVAADLADIPHDEFDVGDEIYYRHALMRGARALRAAGDSLTVRG